MMQRLTKPQGEALVALLGQLRKDWDLPGIRAALTKAAPLGTATEVAVAACRVAGNPNARTPALIPEPGSHWQGTTVAARPVPVWCPDHHGQPAGRCGECAAALVPAPGLRELVNAQRQTGAAA